MVQVLISVEFLVNFQKYSTYTIDQLDSTGDINAESYLFIKRLLGKSEWFLNITQEKITAYKGEHDLLQGDEIKIARIIRLAKANVIRSNSGLYSKIYQGLFNEIDKTKLPHYILLGNAESDICRNIEDELGVIVISMKNMKIPESKMRVVLTKIKDTETSLFFELNKLPFNSLEVEDPYFSENYQVKLKDTKPFIDKKSLVRLSIKTKNTAAFNLQKQEDHLRSIMPSCSISINTIFGKMHDRYIITNTAIIILGNSLFKTTTESTLCQFPIGIYGKDYFDIK